MKHFIRQRIAVGDTSIPARLLFVIVTLIFLGTQLMFLQLSVFANNNPNSQSNEEKVWICHATSSASNPYEKIEVSLSAIDGEGNNDHSSHEGESFNPEIHNQQNKTWGDIIPETEGVNEGQNWDEYGESIWKNDCRVPGEVIGDTCEVGPGYAYAVVNNLQGTMKNGGSISGARADSGHVLGAPDAVTGPDDGFYSLGKAGWITVMFDGYVINEPGDDLVLYEVTNGRSTYPQEKVLVEVSQNGVEWKTVGEFTNVNAETGVDFTDTELGWVRYVRVSDTTDFSLNPAGNADGYDLDAIKAVHIECSEPEPEVASITLIAQKIICEDESLLPNAGGGSLRPIGESTANNWLDGKEGCELAEDWSFEYSTAGNQGNPGNSLVGPKGDPWQTFTADGTNAEVVIPIEGVSLIQTREVLPEGYISFSGNNSQNTTAEFYCHTDARNYDNWEWIQNPKDGDVYYCVAWNAPKETVATLSAQKIICESETDLPNYGYGAPITIGATTAQDWVEASGGNCTLAEWDFQWQADPSTNPGNQTGDADGWIDFSTSTDIEVAGNSTIWVREVFRDGYIPFGGQNTTNNVSAELYCHNDVLNYDNWEKITNLTPGETYYCVAWNVPEEPEVLESSVTLCKVDQQELSLSGWTLMLLGEKVDEVEVPANAPTGANTPSSLTAGVPYVAIAEGTWENRRSPLNEVDAEYSTEDGWTTHMDGFSGFSTDILELQINETFDPNSDWGTYNSSHRYAQGFIQTVDGSANFRIFDGSGQTVNASWYNDNFGSLAVDIYTGYAGITGEDGCVIFENVPYGEYEVAEIMQDGWVNISGLGTKTVDDEEQTFTVVNSNNEGQLLGDVTQRGAIYGFIYEDVNNNGVQDVKELPLEGWSALLLTKNSPYKLIATNVTDTDGTFLFENLDFGTYYVCQEILANWIQTEKPAGSTGLENLIVGEFINGDEAEIDALVSEYCYTVELTPENPISTNNVFGNYKPNEFTPQLLGVSTEKDLSGGAGGEVLGLSDTGQAGIIHVVIGLVFLIASASLYYLTKIRTAED